MHNCLDAVNSCEAEFLARATDRVFPVDWTQKLASNNRHGRLVVLHGNTF